MVGVLNSALFSQAHCDAVSSEPWFTGVRHRQERPRTDLCTDSGVDWNLLLPSAALYPNDYSLHHVLRQKHQPDGEFPASEQGLAGLTDDDFLHLLALSPILRRRPVHPGHHHLEIETLG